MLMLTHCSPGLAGPHCDVSVCVRVNAEISIIGDLLGLLCSNVHWRKIAENHVFRFLGIDVRAADSCIGGETCE